MSLRKAVDQACRRCIFDKHAPGHWKQQVHACDDTTCPLHPVRPRSSKPLTRETLEAYHNHVPAHVETGHSEA